jgi:hypothetical protein
MIPVRPSLMRCTKRRRFLCRFRAFHDCYFFLRECNLPLPCRTMQRRWVRRITYYLPRYEHSYFCSFDVQAIFDDRRRINPRTTLTQCDMPIIWLNFLHSHTSPPKQNSRPCKKTSHPLFGKLVESPLTYTALWSFLGCLERHCSAHGGWRRRRGWVTSHVHVVQRQGGDNIL